MTAVASRVVPALAAFGFEAPLFLLLLAIPLLLWWLHRREPRPATVVLPSLLFLEDEVPAAERAERRRVDLDLLLALCASASLSLAAAGPVFSASRDGRRVTVLVDDGPAMGARSSDGTTAGTRALAVAEAVRRAASGDDEVVVVAASGEELSRRARHASRGLVIVASDRRPRDVPSGVVFVGVGDPAASNAGIVAVAVEPAATGRRVFATIWNDAPVPRRLRAGPVGAETGIDAPVFGAARGAWDLPPAPAAERAPATRIHVVDEGGALAADDEVVLDPSPLAVGFARSPASPPAALLAALRAALDAARPGAWRESDAPLGGLFVGPLADAPAGVAVVLEIGSVPEGAESVRPGKGARFAAPDPEVARDLDLEVCEWVYRRAPGAGEPWPRLSVEKPSAAGPVLVRWHGDPVLGRPAAIETALWPLFVENVARLAGGDAGPAGHRVRGVLDPDVSRLGRDVVAFDPRSIERAPRDVIATRVSLRLAAAVLAAIGLAWLWIRPGGALAARRASRAAR